MNHQHQEEINKPNNTLSRIYPAVKHPCIKVSSSDPACVLSPNSHNLHEISSIGGLAAFLDILSPPYGFDSLIGEERDCHYFQEISANLTENVHPDNVYLKSIPTPAEFWCDQVEYKGPPIDDVSSITNGQ